MQYTRPKNDMLKIILFLACARLILTMCDSKNTIINHGKHLCCFNDSGKVPMIGIGYNLLLKDSEKVMLKYNLKLSEVLSDCQAKRRKYCLTNRQAEDIFYTVSYPKASRCADAFVSNLPPIKRNAIIDVAFTSCRVLNTFKRMQKALEAKNWTRAAHELKSSKWCTQVKQARCGKNYNCIRNDVSYLNLLSFYLY
ncbi:unnamed protein product [Rotaria magnacalcarata]|uniref:Uncharacterized protein n=1 Tax=Rotaria magnacalcarata TaxID=392030 RepID=A0A8S2P4T4_9BILA|nr:unnamed protein product [Rotaria magnacalcarata]